MGTIGHKSKRDNIANLNISFFNEKRAFMHAVVCVFVCLCVGAYVCWCVFVHVYLTLIR